MGAHAYNNGKAWVRVNGQRHKTKLRFHVRNVAEMINKLNGRGLVVNRLRIIKAYEMGGLNGIKAYIDHELELLEHVI